jgi:TetR/AcrR family transcriptional regulator, transcriptional repressor for nem operon
VGDAIAQGFSDSRETILSSLKKVPHEDKWKEIVRAYLSPEHCDHPEAGCPVAALAPEIARAKSGIRKRSAGLMRKWVEFMPGANATERERNFFVIFGAMAGAVSIARILTDPVDRQKVLASMRDHLLHSF